jgi:hypothetical protein
MLYSVVAEVNSERSYLIGFTENPRDFFVEWMNDRTIKEFEIDDFKLDATIIAGGLGNASYHITANPVKETKGLFIRLEGDNLYYF